MVELLYIMRHGESVVNLEHRLRCGRYEGDLTETGRNQAHQAGKWLKHKNIGVICASPFHRTQQTAAIISSYLNLPVITDEGLCELNCGSLESQADGVKTFWKIYQRWLAGDTEAHYPDGESLREGMERYSRVLQKVCSVQGNVLLITHGGISRAVIPLLCGSN